MQRRIRPVLLATIPERILAELGHAGTIGNNRKFLLLLCGFFRQKTVWDHIFSPDCSGINLSEKTLIITEPHFNFHSIQEALTEIFFEEYECDALFRTTAADLSALHHLKSNTVPADCCIIVDMGYSFTHIVPYVKGEKIKSAIRRIDVGGKVLTNHLKEIISYRFAWRYFPLRVDLI